MESNLQERTSAAPLEPMDDMMACSSRPLLERSLKPQPEQALKCPRCDSTNTKFCYYNNYSLSQPRYFCKNCRRYWTKGGSLRNVPVGGGCRKNKRSKRSIMDQTDPVDRRETSTSVSARANTIINHNNNPKELTNTCCSPLLDQTCDILNPGFASSVYNFGNDDINLAFARIQQAAARVGSSEHRHQPALTNCNSASEYLGIAVASGQSALMAGLSPMSSLSALNSLHSFKSSAFNSRALDFNNPRSLTRNTAHDIHDSSTPAAHVHGGLDMNSFIETHPHPQISEAATGIHNFNAPPFSLSMDIHGINDIDIPDAVNQWTMMYQKLPIEYPPLDQHGQELSGGHILTPTDQKPKPLDTAKGSSAEDRSPRLTSPEWKQQNVSSDQTIFETEGKDAIYWNINAGAWPDLSATNYGSSSHQQQQR